MKIIVRGGGYSNKGAETMLVTVHREMLKQFPCLETIAIIPPVSHEKTYVNGITPVSITPETHLRKLLGSRHALTIKSLQQGLNNKDIRSFSWRAPKTTCELNAVCPFDAVIDISGFSYSDECAWGYVEAKETLEWLSFCNYKNVPYFFLPQSWGPFRKTELAEIVTLFTEKASMIYSRDRTSTKFLEAICRDNFIPKLAYDIVFLFEGDPPLVGERKLDELGINQGQPLIGIAPNMRIYEKATGRGGNNHYVQLLTQITRYCIKELDSKVLLLPHEMVPECSPARQDDRYICGLIEHIIADPLRCIAVKSVFSAATTKAIVSQMDMLIGSRFHSLVLALSSNVPAFAFGWSHKYEELMLSCGLSDCCQPFSASLNAEELIRMVDNMWYRKDEIKQVLKGRIINIQDSVRELFDQICYAIENTTGEL